MLLVIKDTLFSDISFCVLRFYSLVFIISYFLFFNCSCWMQVSCVPVALQALVLNVMVQIL